MANYRVIDVETQRAKRQLRAEIALSRAAISDELVALRDERRRLTSWRTYVVRFPTATLATAFAVGLMIAGARPGRKVPRMVASGLLRWGANAVKAGLLTELLNIWNHSQSGAGGSSENE
ncbi:MAG TPA: hypothetical protein VGJ26_19180 [Pirellulales bacterium]|jgi:hypothetical protein